MQVSWNVCVHIGGMEECFHINQHRCVSTNSYITKGHDSLVYYRGFAQHR